MLLAKHVVHIVEVELEQFSLARRFVGSHVYNRLKVKNFGEDAALARVRPSFLQTLRLILI